MRPSGAVGSAVPDPCRWSSVPPSVPPGVLDGPLGQRGSPVALCRNNGSLHLSLYHCVGQGFQRNRVRVQAHLCVCGEVYFRELAHVTVGA